MTKSFDFLRFNIANQKNDGSSVTNVKICVSMGVKFCITHTPVIICLSNDAERGAQSRYNREDLSLISNMDFQLSLWVKKSSIMS